METTQNPASLRALLTHIVDYAGLFPPAQLGMEEAVGNYAEYLAGPHAWMLGRFVVPASRLDEFEVATARHLPRGEGSRPWRLSALVGSDLRTDVDRMLGFNCSHWAGSETGHAVVDAGEVKAATESEIAAVTAQLPSNFRCFVEIPLDRDPESLVAAVARSGAAAKARTGGTSVEAFPPGDAVARFLAACVTAAVPFKVTAGLHHPLRGEYPLTYEQNAPCGAMLGYLNVFLAASALAAGHGMTAAEEILTASRLETLSFDSESVKWGRCEISTATIQRARELAISFGSCSFREPVDELVAAGILE